MTIRDSKLITQRPLLIAESIGLFKFQNNEHRRFKVYKIIGCEELRWGGMGLEAPRSTMG
jgi:hypothetical protein